MKLTNNEMYIKAMDDLISTYTKHNLDSDWIEDVLVNGGMESSRFSEG